MDQQTWNLLDSGNIADHSIFRIRHDRYRFEPSGAEHDFVVLDFPDWVNIIPLTDDGQVVMVKQFRHGTREFSLEIPGGVMEKGELPEAAAVRELREESGYVARRVKQLGCAYPNPAIQNNRNYCFLAEGCYLAGSQQLDPFEHIEVLLKPLEEIPGLISKGEISNALIITAFALLRFV